MRLFLDTEFTGLRQQATLISLGMVSDDDHEFYAEFSDYDEYQVNEWIRENVLAHLQWGGDDEEFTSLQSHGMRLICYGNHARVVAALSAYLEHWPQIEIWSDVLAYDWMLFCELFGGAQYLPKNVYYIPFDLATAMAMVGINPDVNREEFSHKGTEYKHHALHDAQVIRACFHRLPLGGWQPWSNKE